MRLVTFEREGRIRAGALANGTILDLSLAYGCIAAERGLADAGRLASVVVPSSILGIMRGGARSLEAVAETVDRFRRGDLPSHPSGLSVSYSLDECRIRAPIIRPSKLMLVGINHPDVLEWRSSRQLKVPWIFMKPTTCVIGDGDTVVLPRELETFYPDGVELALVINQRARRVSRDRYLGVVAGFTLLTDVTAGDPFSSDVWLYGLTPEERMKGMTPKMREYNYGIFRQKCFDTFAPLGPCIVTKDQLDPTNLWIECRVNDQLVHRGNTRDMVFGIPEIIEFVSSVMTLEPGDIIAMGQCGAGRRHLKDGDMLTAYADGIGSMSNPVRSEV